MQILCSADKADGGHAISMKVHGLLRRFDQLGMICQTKIVVRTEVYHARSFGRTRANCDPGTLR
jgi:hypothetical protein